MFSFKYVLSNILSSPKRSINLWAGRGTLWKICLAIVKCCSILFRKNKSPVFTWSNICLPLFEGIELPQALKLLNSLKSISSWMLKVNYFFQFVGKWSHSCMFFPTGNISLGDDTLAGASHAR